MADEISIQEEPAMAMVSAFNAGRERTQDTISEMLKIAGMMEDGAFVGKAGASFVEAIRDNLVVSLGKLDEMLEELAKDVTDALKTMQDKDSSSASTF